MGTQGCQLVDSIDSEATRPMRILIDARKLGHGGIGVYLDNLVSGLVEQRVGAVSLIARQDAVKRHDWAAGVSIIEDPAPLYSFDEIWRMPKRIDMSRFDLFHVPHFVLPFRIKIPTVVTIHDITQIRQPERFFYPWVAGALVRSALSRASRVLTVSQATYDDLAWLVGNNKRILSKMRVVPNALDPCFAKATRNHEFIAQRFQIRGKYLLSVFSNLKPHKGLEDLLRAFSWLRNNAANGHGQGVADVRLVLAGQGTQELARVERLLEIAGSIKNVHILGEINKEELASLYANALGVVVPSCAEGFCLPVLEAQAAGVPVLARPIAAVQELLTENDTVCPDFSFAALRQSLATFVEDLLKQGRSVSLTAPAHLKRYCRSELSKVVIRVYREALGRS